MKVNTYQCNYCSVIKGSANHWWMVNVSTETMIVGFILVPWHDLTAGIEVDGRAQYEHICGNVCAGRALESWLGKQGKRE